MYTCTKNRALLLFIAVSLSKKSYGEEVTVDADGTIDSDPAMDVRFVNQLPVGVDLFWIDFHNEEVPVGSIGPGETIPMGTYEGHSFVCRRIIDGENILQSFRMDRAQGVYAVDQNPKECHDRKGHCVVSAARGECDRSPGWMTLYCPVSCNRCHLRDPAVRCSRDRLNISSETAYDTGGLETMFNTALTDFQELEPKVLSRDPWVMTFDKFLNDSEIDGLLNSVSGNFQRSTDTGSYDKFGEADKVVSKGRTSENAWCRDECDKNPMVQSIIGRIEKVLKIPYENYEQFQVLKYTKGQYYRTHHDYGVSQLKLACGPRILTFFLYLSDVEEGGETNFPRLKLKVPPKKGKALLWPSVLDSDLRKQDSRTSHEALPVIRGIKLAANAWIHLHNFHVPNHWGCTGSFD